MSEKDWRLKNLHDFIKDHVDDCRCKRAFLENYDDAVERLKTISYSQEEISRPMIHHTYTSIKAWRGLGNTSLAIIFDTIMDLLVKEEDEE